MKCRRCNIVDVPSFITSSRPLTDKEIQAMGYCGRCWRIEEFERAKYVTRPYKIPIDRRVV